MRVDGYVNPVPSPEDPRVPMLYETQQNLEVCISASAVGLWPLKQHRYMWVLDDTFHPPLHWEHGVGEGYGKASESGKGHPDIQHDSVCEWVILRSPAKGSPCPLLVESYSTDEAVPRDRSPGNVTN